MAITDVHRTFSSTAAECPFLSSVQRMLSVIDQMSGHKTILNKFQKTSTISGIFPNHNETELDINNKRKMELDINNKRKTGKFTNGWKFKTTPLSK